MRTFKLAALVAAAALIAPMGAAVGGTAPGSLDKAFSTDGRAEIDFGRAYGDQVGTDVLPLASGKTVVVSDLATSTGHVWGLTRLKDNGAPDPHFHANGRRTTSFTGNDSPQRVVSLGGGRILVAGNAGADFAMAVYLHDGSLDPSFGTGGKVVTDVSPGGDQVMDLVVRSDGSILAAGRAGDRFAVARYTAHGHLDTTFGTNGVVTTTAPFPGPAFDVLLQPDGRLLVSGESTQESTRPIAVARYLADGSPDPSFGGGDGLVTTVPPEENDESRGYTVMVDADGRIVVGGTMVWADYSYFVLVRYRSDGMLDPSFGENGVVIHSGDGYYADVLAVAQQDDGKIVAAGWTGRESKSVSLVVNRFTTSGAWDTSFSGDGMAIVGFGAQPGSEARAVAIGDGRIVAAGYKYDITKARSVTAVARVRQ